MHPASRRRRGAEESADRSAASGPGSQGLRLLPTDACDHCISSNGWSARRLRSMPVTILAWSGHGCALWATSRQAPTIREVSPRLSMPTMRCLSRAGGAPSSFPSLVRPWNRSSLRREHTGSPLSMLPPLAINAAAWSYRHSGRSGSPLFGQNSSPITTPRPAIGLQICQHTLVMDPCRCKLHGGMSTGPRAPSGWRGTTIGNSVRPSCRWCRVSGLPRRPPD